mmetsp:Transcript_6228/g.11897  ORF Transcript_6228/g.11897 Transcript_6228/m.11897 type:complete len:361 (-) Transcript_6228:273-1355(-)
MEDMHSSGDIRGLGPRAMSCGDLVACSGRSCWAELEEPNFDIRQMVSPVCDTFIQPLTLSKSSAHSCSLKAVGTLTPVEGDVDDGYALQMEARNADDFEQLALSNHPRRMGHRRSASDTFALNEFQVFPDLHVEWMQNFNRGISETEVCMPVCGYDGDQLNGEQLMSMFMDVEAVNGLQGIGEKTNTLLWSNNLGTHQTATVEEKKCTSTSIISCESMPPMQSQDLVLAINPTGSFNKQGNDNELECIDNDGAGKMNPRLARRILANRQSAQRSRMRKLQYISELEKNVARLHREVDELNPMMNETRQDCDSLSLYIEDARLQLSYKSELARKKALLTESIKAEINDFLCGKDARASSSP